MGLEPKNGLIRLRQFIAFSEQPLKTAGLCGLYLFAAGSFVSVSMADFGMAVMFSAFALYVLLHPYYLIDKLSILSCLFGAYLIFQVDISSERDPGTFMLQLEQASHLYRLGFFTILATAFWLAIYRRHYNSILFIILLSFLFRIAIKIDAGDIDQFLNGERAYLDMSPNSLGLYCAAAILGILLYTQRILGTVSLCWPSFLRIAGWCLVLMVAVAIFIFAQSRAVWIASAIIFPTVLLAQLLYNHRNKINRIGQAAIFLAILVSATTLLFWTPTRKLVFDRVVFETETLVDILDGDLSDLKMDAYGLRISWLQLGLEKWRERPIVGHGPASINTIMAEINIKIGDPYGHLHNFYLQVLIQIGLIGLLFFVLQYGLIFTAAWKAYRARWLDFETLLFLIGLFGLFAIASLSGLPSKDHFGRNYLAFWGGIAYAYRFSLHSADSSARASISLEHSHKNAPN